MPRGKVLLVESDDETRRMVAEGLTKRGMSVVCVKTGAEGIDRARCDKPDLVILGVEMPGLGGIETCQEIRKSLLSPIVLVGEHAGESDIVLGLGVGADYYVKKPFGIVELLAVAEAAMRREILYCQRRAEKSRVSVRDLVVDFSSHEVKRNGQMIPLSPTEFRLFGALAHNAGRILTRTQLLESVWDTKSDDVYSRTVDVHIGRIRRKIGDNVSRQRYIVTVPGVGYKMAGG